MKCKKCGSSDIETCFTEDLKQFYYKCNDCGSKNNMEAITDDYKEFQKMLKCKKNV